MFYNKLTVCNKAKGEGEWEGEREGGREEGSDGGQQFLHSLPVLNHPTWDGRRGAEEEAEERKRFFFRKKKKKIFYRSICLVVLNAPVVKSVY